MKIVKWSGKPVKIEFTKDNMSVEFDEQDFINEVVDKLPSFTFVVKDNTAKQIVKNAIWNTLLDLHIKIKENIVSR